MNYDIVIGLEVHVELKTNSKVFCSCTTKFGGEPNTHCCPVCSGMPGSLPVLNKKAVGYALKAGLALNCSISGYSVLDRKNYFYPDLPKAYQISQLYKPFCLNGYIDIISAEENKRIGIREIHLEEDAGKLIHDDFGIGTLVDFNRCGVPLIEIVTLPDLSSPGETKIFLENLKAILEYIDISDCKMQEGSLRVDVNVSVKKKGSKKLGTRTEMKNLNSFKAVVRAIDNESERQIRLIEEGGRVIQETRRWDDDKGMSFSMRSKEEAHDYRYFPEPDLIPVVISQEWLFELSSELPELPLVKAARYVDAFKLPAYDAGILTSSKSISEFFDQTLKEGADPKTVSNWLMGEYMKLHNDSGISDYVFRFTPGDMFCLIEMIEKGTITGKIAKDIFIKMYKEGKDPLEVMKEEKIQVLSDSDSLIEAAKKVIETNPRSVQDYMNGKNKAVGFLMGQIMKETRGMADPQKAKNILIELLSK